MVTRSSQERQDRQEIGASNASTCTGSTDVSVRHIAIQSRNPITAIKRSMGLMVMHAGAATISGRPHRKAYPQTPSQVS